MSQVGVLGAFPGELHLGGVIGVPLYVPLATLLEIVPGEWANSRLAVSTSLGAGSGVGAVTDVLGVFPLGAGTTGRGVIKVSSPAELAPETVSASETT